MDAATLLNDATPRDVACVVGSCPDHAGRSRVTAEYANYIRSRNAAGLGTVRSGN